MEEEAKAVQEVAKATTKALETNEKLGRFLREIIGDGLKELGGSFGDWAQYYRETNLLKIYDKREEIYRKRKIEGKTNPLPSRYAIPIIQNASQEDDESIQNMWADLIANSTDPNTSIIPKKIYMEILSSLEPLDAKLLKFFPKQGWNMIPGPHSEGFNVQKLSQALGENQRDIQLSLQNLARLGCIMDSYNQTWDSSDSASFGAKIFESTTTYRPTPLGFDLITVVMINNNINHCT